MVINTLLDTLSLYSLSDGTVHTSSLHEGITFSIHSLNRTGSAAVYYITVTMRQVLTENTQNQHYENIGRFN